MIYKITKVVAILSAVMFLLSLITGIYLIVLDHIKIRYEHFFYTELYDLAYYSLSIELFFILVFIVTLMIWFILFLTTVAIDLLNKNR